MDNTASHFGVHYMLDGYKADLVRLSDKVALKQILVTLPQKIGMHAISDPMVVEVGPKNKKDPGGISGFSQCDLTKQACHQNCRDYPYFPCFNLFCVHFGLLSEH